MYFSKERRRAAITHFGLRVERMLRGITSLYIVYHRLSVCQAFILNLVKINGIERCLVDYVYSLSSVKTAIPIE